MKFRMEFDCDNAAFGPAPADLRDETARILRSAMGRVGAGDVDGGVFDHDGEKVGSWAFTEDAGG